MAPIEKPLRAVEEILRAVTECLPGGYPSARRVSEKVGTSVRTLHRKLSEQGLTYQDVVDSVRRETSIVLLERGDLTVTEISFLLGFSDVSSFRRAFRRWTGRSPRSKTRPPRDAKN
jgi:AraC-like DNA-binding protein